MSKEYLETLEKIKQEFNCDPEYYGLGGAFEIIESALQRLDSIDKSNPSEALKWIKNKIADLEDDLQHYTMVEKDKCKEHFIRWDLEKFQMVEQALLKAQEQKQYVDELKLVEKKLKALEIINKKDPNITEIKCCKDYEHYKERISRKYDTEIVKIDWNDKDLLDYLYLLTAEEFNILIEVLEC